MKLMDENQIFYQLLRFSLGLQQTFPHELSADVWQSLYRTSAKQGLVGICYQGICKLPPAQQPPFDLALTWSGEAETIRGMNIQQNQEAARLTQLFAAEGRKSAILKGQANARLYPNKFSRNPGDIDIWVEGGKESVIALLRKMGMIDEAKMLSAEHDDIGHHVHLEPDSSEGITIEIHYRPSPCNNNPFSNRRLQQWLQQEIQKAEMTDEGFYVPSVRFALVMQLTHIQEHFLRDGIGMRQIIDYYWLLMNASADDLEVVGGQLKRFGLANTARALMWVLREVLHIEERQMLLKPDEYRGKQMLSDAITGGNFGYYSKQFRLINWNRILWTRWRRIKMIRFDFREGVWLELRFWRDVMKTMPERIRKRAVSLGDAQ